MAWWGYWWQGICHGLKTENNINVLKSIASRLSAVLLVILTTAIVLAAVLNYYKFKASQTNLQISRYSFVLSEVKSTVETSLNLGLPLNQLPNIGALLTDQAAEDNSILSIDIFDDHGSALFSTDSSFVGDLVAETWVDAAKENTLDNWYVEERDANAIGLTISDNLGQIAGFVAVRYSRIETNRKLEDVAKRLALTAFIIILVATMVGVIILHFLVSPWSRQIHTYGSIVNILRSQPGEKDENTDKSNGEIDSQSTEGGLKSALLEIDDIRSQLRQLDSKI